MRYVGRFAPSPTGPLHAGSIAAALACACDALVHAGRCHLRIEDIDAPRNAPGAAQSIIETLWALGFVWSDDVVFQSQRVAAYLQAFEHLQRLGLVYPCGCSRAEIKANALGRSRDGEPIYPGTCASGLAVDRSARSCRLRLPDRTITFADRWAGEQSENPQRETGDIVIKRADGPWAYHLAVVVDDIALRVTHIVRGDDLLYSTARQRVIFEALNAPPPTMLHIPVVRNATGEKLSKQTGAIAVDPKAPLDALHRAAAHLDLAIADVATIDRFWRAAPNAWERRLQQQSAMLESERS